MSENKNVDNLPQRGELDVSNSNLAVSSTEVSSIAGSANTTKTHQRMSSSSERQIKFERAQKCLENAALVSKRIKEHRKATAELLGRPFDEDDGGDTASEMASTMSERTGYSAATDTSTTLSVQDALNIPGISESLANTLKQKELLMERIKQYKEISKRPIIKTAISRRESMADAKLDIRKSTDNSDVTALQNTIKDKENALSIMQVKMKAMETTILDLQEKINEKDQIIEAKNKATTLMSDSLSKKEKDTLILLEDTRQQMIKMQENFVTVETEWKEEKQTLLKEIEVKNEKITNLEEANTILENSRFEISVAHSKLAEELELKNKEISELQNRLEKISEDNMQKNSQKELEGAEGEEKGSLEIANMVELTKKIELLEQLNCQIRQTNKELENKLNVINPDSKSPTTSSPSKKASPVPTRKGGRNTSAKIKSPWSHLSSESLNQETEKKPNKNDLSKMEMLVQSLNKDILEKEYVISQKDTLISELESTNAEKDVIINELKFNVKSQTKSKTDMVDIAISTETEETSYHLQSDTKAIKQDENVKAENLNEGHNISELEEKLKAAEEQIAILNNEIDTANRNMIKVKSNHKLKLKQMQKTIDNFSKVSDSNAEIVKLNEELRQLSQKVAELEEEKGNLQLHLVDYDSGRLTETDVYKKMVEMENLAETRLKAISVLEAQKFDLVQELHVLQQKNVEMEDKLADMSQLQNEQVCSEIKSVQLEEQIDELTSSKKELELVIKNLKLDKEQLNENIKLLQEEKEDLNHKLEQYIQENIELTDKLEKLSAEKVSSAESIEIVESLTTQEKLELEEYNKGMTENKINDDHTEKDSEGNIEKLFEESAELNRKLELFTQERQEVMEKMSKLSAENELLQEKISGFSDQAHNLRSHIEMLKNEKQELQSLNEELSQQIEELKHERIEIMKESVEITKPASIEEAVEGASAEIHHEDKSVGDKGISRTKSVKQLTKEILKLKNIIKEREAEIGDCQMKILSLEEQQQKQNELMQSNASYESKVKSLLEENNQLKGLVENLKKDKESEQVLVQIKQANELLHLEIRKIKHEFSNTVNMREARIQELENLLVEYEKQIFNYGNTLQQKDKEIVEYMNQITKLNDVSQKLKSTIELLEEEKAKDQNAELVKSLNKQISVYQKKFTECEEKIRILEEEKVQILSLKSALENKNASLESDLKILQETITEKQSLIKELQLNQQKHTEEMSAVIFQAKERDEEIHEIKLQLRKESIENEKLRNSLTEKDKITEQFTQEIEDSKVKINNVCHEKEQLREQYVVVETKNKELIEKLKKYAFNIKKKSAMYSELENQLRETQKILETKSQHLEQLSIQVETLPAIQEKLKHAEEELNRLQSAKVAVEQQTSYDIMQLQTEIKSLTDKLAVVSDESVKLNDLLKASQQENINYKSHIDTLSNKLVEYEIEQKNNTNFVTKISSLELDINQKQNQIAELLSRLETQEQQLSQLQFGHDAKVQERDLYIESLEAEMSKYKNRISRLEESISIMEDRRHSLERKADQLDTQLQEKQKAYTEYTSHEDELVNRLAVLMDHDRVIEKQLHEIESENKELQYKVQNLSEDNHHLRKSLSDIQEHCNTLVIQANRADLAESEAAKYQAQMQELESHLKRVTHDHQSLMTQKKRDIEELESEFNIQIENAIKEKKILSEKYEKLTEHVTKLEHKLQEYKNNIQNLNINLEELTGLNQELMEKSVDKELVHAKDYTNQYISEINKLNALVNNKNQEIIELHNKIETLQANNVATQSNYEIKIGELHTKVNEFSVQIDELNAKIQLLTQNNEQLDTLLQQKEVQFQQLMEKKRVSFEMTIPKTEGLFISSTIEALSDEPKNIDISSIESQIVSDTASPYPDDQCVKSKISEHVQKKPYRDTASSKIEESVIVAKKAYLCYKGDENSTQESDPFNSDEGWGLGECEESGDVMTGLFHLNEVQQLKKENDTLKADLEASSAKLIKAMKKLKALKINNDMLSNELKISKQISQSSNLDSAIEDELKNNIQDLEKKIEETNAELVKEKREKEALKKQNELFSNANDRLTEMKEKLDNELELWKYKFKEANDKMSSLEWGSDQQQVSASTIVATIKNTGDTDELIKLEKENDELQAMIDQITSQNKELTYQQSQMKDEINNLNKQLQQNQMSCENCENINSRLLEMQNNYTDLLKTNETLRENLRDVDLRYKETSEKYEQLKVDHEELQKMLENNNKDYIAQRDKLVEEIQSLRISESDNKSKISVLNLELQELKTKLLLHEQHQALSKSQELDTFAISEKYTAMEDHCLQLKVKLEDANNKIKQLETTGENNDISSLVRSYDLQISELNTKIENLNTENDQLLSTVAELRSSISSAVDQRGFEIAELWKQHLAQREADFQKTEQQLREQLSSFETKYEQLLDNVQSSSQEETNKLVIMEQITSLQNKLQDKEDHIRNLQDKYAEVMNQLDILRSEMEDEKLVHESKLLGQQEEYEKQIKELTLKDQQHSEGYEQAFQNVQSELVASKTRNEELSQQVEELQKIIKESEVKILDLSNQLRIKESEIYQKSHDYTITLTQRNEEFENVRKKLIEYENKLEDLNYEKESELAVLRLKMHDNGDQHDKMLMNLEAEKSVLTKALNEKIIECTNLNKQLSEFNQILEEKTAKTTEMHTALENQEIEIVTLKDEIIKLQDLLSSSTTKIEKHVTFASDTKPGNNEEKSEGTLNKELLDAVPRAELDLALYMMHQRDVRCEELTMELTQLLEERDTLQLRLSDSLRSYEELKSKCASAGLDVSLSSSQETISELPSFTVEKEQQFVETHRGQTSRSSSISDPDGEKPKLQAKLSELRSVKHSRDVRLRQDSEQRQLGMRLLQRDVAHLPPEAVDQLAQAHHTLSRDSQSTSTVLLNWFRGKSTPKVVHM